MAGPEPGRDVPITLGPSLLDPPGSTHLHAFRYDFRPVSVQAASRGLFVEHPQKDQPTKVMLIPALLDETGAAQGHYAGTMEPSKPGADEMDCVLVYDGTQWTLDVLSTTARVRYTKGEPPGYDLSEALQAIAQMDAPGEDTAGAHPQPPASDAGTSAAAATAGAAPHNALGAGHAAAAQPEPVDPDLDALLDGALWSGAEPVAAGSPAGADGAHAPAARAADEHDGVWEQFGSADGGGVSASAVLAGGASSDDDDGAGAQVSDESDGLGAEMF